MQSRRKWFATAAAAGVLVALSACGTPTSPTSTGQTTPASTPAGEAIKLTFWGKAQGHQEAVDLWNSKNPDIQITFAAQGGDIDLSQALQNATAAGNAPDVFEVPRTYAVSFLADGVSRDITEWFNNDDAAFAEGAYDFVKVGDVTAGVPVAMNPTFNAINAKTFEKYGFEAPKTWAEFLEQAKKMNEEGEVKSMNLPGEDTSYLRDIATQFGVEWWQPEADGWRIGFTSPESKAAGDIIQQAVDAGIVSNHTYIEWDALMQFFGSGKLSQFTTSTWQLPVYEQNFAESVGDWEVAPYPAESDPANLVSPSYYNIFGVSPQSEHPEAAVKFARWFATDPEAVAIMADPVTGSAQFPVVADPSAVIDELLPSKLLGDTRPQANDVVKQAAKTSRSMGEGPNQAAASEVLVDLWAKVLTKDLKMDQLLEQMQEWTVNDLKSKNINVVN